VRRFTILPLGAAVLMVVSTAAQPTGPIDVRGILARVGEQVEQYFARAQSVVCQETVRLTPLSYDLAFDGSHQRQLVYELRIAWEAPLGSDEPPDIKVLREIVTIDGRKPRPKDEPGCLDPKPVSPEPLAMLLPGRQREYVFTYAGLGKADDRPAVMLDYRSREKGKIDVTRSKDCISVELPGYTAGRVWLDQGTGDVLRLSSSQASSRQSAAGPVMSTGTFTSAARLISSSIASTLDDCGCVDFTSSLYRSPSMWFSSIL